MGLLEGPGLLLLGVVGILLSYRFLFRTPALLRDGIPLRKPPNTLPLVGNGILFLQARQKLFSWFVKCERQFGYETFQISVPSLPPGVVINDPRNLEYVFKHEGPWRAQRKAGLAFLNTANLRVLTDVALPRYLSESVASLKRCGGLEGAVVDLQSVFHEITSQLMGKMAYNMEMHADDEFTVAFDHASGVTAERFQNPLWFVTELVTGARFRRSLATLKSFGEKIVRSAIEDRRNGNNRATSGSKLDEVSGTLIQSFLDTISNEEFVAEAALNYLSAGRDTVAQALTWTMMLLMHNQSATGKVRNEVQQLVQSLNGSDGADNGAAKTVLSVNFTPVALPYTMAVFYESLRLYPPIPFEIKQCEKATTLPDGTFLPSKSVLVFCPWAMNRSHISWGEDADEFRPERWLADGKLVTKSASEFPVFNGGARTCLGKKMAELMAAQVIATMILTFDFMPAYSTKRVSKSSLTLPMEGGLPCYVKTRKEMGA
ncbi:cytochrome P450 [Apiospora phragmitis]|uniref:Cytochrome P450 n=1 Tax=Apiospora phragmitis TaxID=2905665 RepID=A0ABR1VCY3_9PEZI